MVEPVFFPDLDITATEPHASELLLFMEAPEPYASNPVQDSVHWIDDAVASGSRVEFSPADVVNQHANLVDILTTSQTREHYPSTAPSVDNHQTNEADIQLSFPLNEEVSPLTEADVDPLPLLEDAFSLDNEVSPNSSYHELSTSPIGSFNDTKFSGDMVGREDCDIGEIALMEVFENVKNSSDPNATIYNTEGPTNPLGVKKRGRKGKGRRKSSASGSLSVDNFLSQEQKDAILKESKPKMTRRKARFPQAQPSKFCHVCARQKKVARQMVCCKIKEGICRKVICEKCFKENGWDWEEAINDPDKWQCPHCSGICPPRSQCSTYKRVNDKLREDRILTQHLRPVKPVKKTVNESSPGTGIGAQAAAILPRPETSSPSLYVLPLMNPALPDPSDAIVIPESLFDI